ncbi:hypothetical protein K2X30_06440 [bacterium]|jgi:hypothetical protein|nr:hypothetical protein [bacterium]
MPTYFVSGVMAIVISWICAGAFSGCRFGNKEVYQENPDKISGFYQTAPHNVQACAVLSSATTCQPATVNHLPDTFTLIFSNPVAMVQKKIDSPAGYFAHLQGVMGDPTYKYTLGINIFSDGTLGSDQLTQASTYWPSSTCTSQISLVEDGTYKIYATPIENASLGLHIKGEIALNVQLAEILGDQCATALAQMKACYLNEADCGGANAAENTDRHLDVVARFDNFISLNVLNANDIPNLKALAYSVDYQ